MYVDFFLTSHEVLYCVKRSLHKRSLINLFTKEHWSLTLTMDLSNLWKHCYRFTHLCFFSHTFTV